MILTNKENIVKYQGECIHRAKRRWCYYWRARQSKRTGKVTAYRCALFDKDKIGYASLPECNTQYGLTYEGKQ